MSNHLRRTWCCNSLSSGPHRDHCPYRTTEDNPIDYSAPVTVDTVRPYIVPTGGSVGHSSRAQYIGVQLADGRIFVEPASVVDRERAAKAFERIMELCKTLTMDMLDLIGPLPGPLPDGRPDEDADYADPRVDYSAIVCFCDWDHPAYRQPPDWGDDPRCCGGGANPAYRDGSNGGHEWNCSVIKCPRHPRP